MSPRQMRLGWHDELIVDSFAGGGGASVGIETALGRSPDIAINHDAIAIAVHEANHPNTRHLHSDVWEVEPRAAVRGRPVGLAWFSPDCRHFSKAKGGQPVSAKVRSLAWVVVRWARAVRPRVLMLENVEEFATWGPLGENGKPCPLRRGQTFRHWWAALERLGYRLECRELVAADYGAPTMRRRLFIIGRCDGEPIAWPAPTHGQGFAQPHRCAAEIIDWSLPVPSIFTRPRPLVESTHRRIARGLRRYVLEHPQPYIVRSGHARSDCTTGDSMRGQKPGRPLSTVTTVCDYNLVAPYVVGIDHKSSGASPAWAPSDPLTTITTENRHALVAAWMAQHNGGMTGHDLREPVSTITVTGSHQQLVTVAAEHGTRAPLVRAWLCKYYGTNVGSHPAEPLHTVTTRDRFGLVQVHGRDYALTDIGMRMLSPRELFRAQGFPDDYVIDTGPGGRPLPKSAQVRLAGNSVCPPLAAALVRANVGAAMADRAASFPAGVSAA